ncbi:MAG: helix-turn-helix transcriptional regulator [Bacilli bacterium]|nr:helix-turn-helix transcriptional regulator [Bacilli bacterium]
MKDKMIQYMCNKNNELRVKMILDYNKLWKLMIDKNINKTELCKQAKISTNAMAKMGRNESVPLDTLVKICDVLKCTLNDVVEIKSKEENNGDN